MPKKNILWSVNVPAKLTGIEAMFFDCLETKRENGFSDITIWLDSVQVTMKSSQFDKEASVSMPSEEFDEMLRCNNIKVNNILKKNSHICFPVNYARKWKRDIIKSYIKLNANKLRTHQKFSIDPVQKLLMFAKLHEKSEE